MTKEENYAEINGEGKLVIHTDNGVFLEGVTHTEMANRTFAISGEDLMKIYSMLNDRDVTLLLNVREGSCFRTINNYMFIGKDVEKKRLMDMYIKLLYEVEEINKNRHWWERKIKIERTL